MSSLVGARVLCTGGTGFLGTHVCRELTQRGAQIYPVSRRIGYDLRNEAEVLSAVLAVRPTIIIHLAATVGGIGANMDAPGTFFRDNIVMGVNVIHASAVARVPVIVAGTLCSYAKFTKIPFKEEDFWEGFPEETNAPYGMAKKALLVMCQAYRKQYGLSFGYVVPCNLFGPEDNFHPHTSHVIPALIRRFMEAKDQNRESVVCWGSGKATRAFLYVKDAAKAIVRACEALDYDGPVNLAGTEEVKVQDLAEMVAKEVGYKGKIEWDLSKPDGQPRRAVDGTLAKEILGWAPETGLSDGIRETVRWYDAKRKLEAGQK